MNEIAPVEKDNKDAKDSKSKKDENVLVLKRPIKIDGEKVSEIAYDFDELTATDIMKADKLSSNAGEMKTSMMEFNNAYHFQLFVQAAIKKNPDYDESDIERLKGRDVIKAMRLGRVFLMETEDGEDET